MKYLNKFLSSEHSIFLSTEPFYAIVEFMQYGDLLGFLRKRRGLKDDFYLTQNDIKDSLTSKELLSFAADTARGMDFLATNKVCQFTFVLGWGQTVQHCWCNTIVFSHDLFVLALQG